MKVLFLGDVFGKPGRNAVKRLVPRLIARHGLDLVVANAENVASGVGVTPDSAEELLAAEVDLLTSGNHIWAKREIVPYLEAPGSRLLRPANYPEGAPGRGHAVVETPDGRKLGVLNLEGRVFMKDLDDPFRLAEKLVADLKSQGCKAILVDMHCDATSEKNAMGWFLDGRVSAVLGTHTHIQTADARVLPGGTAFITDVGMCGPWDSVIGVRRELVLERFLSQRPVSFEPAKRDVYLQGALVDIDESTGRARAIERVQERDEEQP
ncbi:MAG TPA: TIGR00282 family metallophosphoesterase [Anaeromyxobacteraceae bacterium]|nr:TIGR00282 family metallophosphoesterase [Anaeromyxobacteraceae bacterium]